MQKFSVLPNRQSFTLRSDKQLLICRQKLFAQDVGADGRQAEFFLQKAGEPMSGAPDVVDEQQLKDLSIALTLKD